ncbi:MAG: hypothetical protein F4Y78_05160 [Candidatus Dadabacteria bacterium]|nr:hypothetical protein [Candidatus Dadabacteria bacterium]MYA47946.1 hypothetical protein [Candidatus Dadabacteria bacterium]MYG82866.1 hypothetical protein [Candidatus Dadabacteria bacterium]MYK49184.1 hypothetical protein [Candidatus Dadabacteria bacterium]
MGKLPSRRKILISFLLILCLGAGGCRLFRFLEVKRQLGNFTENFSVSDHDGLRLTFKKPVLLAGDMAWLMVYSPPVKTRVSQDTELWTYHLVKKYPGRKSEGGNFDLDMGMKLCQEKLCEIIFPERFTKYISKEVLGKVMGSVGGAEVKKLDKTSTAAVRSLEPKEIPNLSEVIEILGRPYAKLNEEGGSVFVYKYRLREKTPEGKYIVFRLLLNFDEKTEKLKKLVLPLRSVRLAMNFESDGAGR